MEKQLLYVYIYLQLSGQIIRQQNTEEKKKWEIQEQEKPAPAPVPASALAKDEEEVYGKHRMEKQVSSHSVSMHNDSNPYHRTKTWMLWIMETPKSS